MSNGQVPAGPQESSHDHASADAQGLQLSANLPLKKVHAIVEQQDFRDHGKLQDKSGPGFTAP